METLGFIGLGKIGLPIAKSLLGSGYRVVGYRRSSMEEFAKAGGVIARSPGEVSASAEIVLSCLPSEDALDDVYEDLVPTARSGQVFVELGSHSLPRKERYLEPLAARGAAFIDGEVSGTPGMIQARRGVLYLSGDASSCRRLEAVANGFIDKVMFFGAFGAASKIKLINNLLVAVHIAATAEAMALGIRAGVDLDLLIKAVTSGSGASTQFNIRAPWMAERRFLPAEGDPEGLSHYFALIHEFAAEAGAATPLLDQASKLYRKAINAGFGGHDNAVLVDFAGRPLDEPDS